MPACADMTGQWIETPQRKLDQRPQGLELCPWGLFLWGGIPLTNAFQIGYNVVVSNQTTTLVGQRPRYLDNA